MEWKYLILKEPGEGWGDYIARPFALICALAVPAFVVWLVLAFAGVIE